MKYDEREMQEAQPRTWAAFAAPACEADCQAIASA